MKAGNSGSVTAQFALGNIYYEKRDYKKSAEVYSEIAGIATAEASTKYPDNIIVTIPSELEWSTMHNLDL